MKIFRPLLAIALTILSAGTALARDAEPNSKRLSIGSTGVLCYVEPCPWRGVVDLDDQARDPLRPLWSGEELPGLIAAPADIEQILAAWEAMDCLEIEGAVADPAADDRPPVLRVNRIIGACA